MGEYARKGDQSVKLGTYEDLFYVTKADVMALKATGWKGDDGNDLQSYLDDRTFRFLLPTTPGSPGDLDTISEREFPSSHYFRIPFDPSSSLADLLLDKIDHLKCYTDLKPIDRPRYGQSPRLVHPCPLSREWIPGCVKVDGGGYVDLCMEGAKDGRAIYRCPFCGSKFNLVGSTAQSEVLDSFRKVYGLNNKAIESIIMAGSLAEVALAVLQ